jgi:hypothetical protein
MTVDHRKLLWQWLIHGRGLVVHVLGRARIIGVDSTSPHSLPRNPSVRTDACSVLPAEILCGLTGPQTAPAERSGEPRPGHQGEVAAAGDRSGPRQFAAPVLRCASCAEATGPFDFATGFRDGHRPLVCVDPLVNVFAALCEQTSKVFGLALIRCRSRRSNAVIDSSGRPVHGHRRHGLAVTDVTRPTAVLSDGPCTFRPLGVRQASIAPIRVRGAVRVACATLVGRSGEGHPSLSTGGLISTGGNNIRWILIGTICARDEAQDHFCARSINR